jgi:glutamate-5-semialdehyde dehydrogenase
MTDATFETVAARAREAAHELAVATRATKDAALHAMADALASDTAAVLAANAEDVTAAREAETPDALVDRLRLTEDRVAGMAAGLRDVAGLPDPVGEVVRGSTLANGLELRQVRVPFGVIGIIYEARPNVTADAAGICLKAGSAVLLRGSSSARHSNEAVVAVLREAAASAGLNADVVQLVPGRATTPRRR